MGGLARNIHKKYLRRIYLWVMLATMVLIIVFSAGLYINMEDAVLKKEAVNNEKILGQLKISIDNMHDVIRNMGASLYYSNESQSLMFAQSEGAVYDLITKMGIVEKSIGAYSFIHSVNIYNGTLDTFYSTYQSLSNVDHNLKLLLNSSAGLQKMKFIPLSIESTYGQREDLLSFAVFESVNSSGKPDGAVIINIRTQWLADHIRSLTHNDGTGADYISIIDKEGSVLFGTGPAVGSGQATRETLSRFWESNPGEASFDFMKMEQGGREYLTAFIRVENADWSILMMQDDHQFSRFQHQLKVNIVVLTLIFLLVVLFSSYMVSGTIYMPFGRFVKDVVSRIPEDELEQDQQDELDLLSRIFQSHVRQIEQFRDKAHSNNRVMMSFYLRSMLAESRTMSEEEWKKAEEAVQLDLSGSNSFCVCVVHLDRFAGRSARFSERQKELYGFAAANVLTECLARDYACASVDLKNGQLVLLVSMLRGKADEAGGTDAHDAHPAAARANDAHTDADHAAAHYAHTDNAEAAHHAHMDLADARLAGSSRSMDHAVLQQAIANAQQFIRQHYKITFSVSVSNPSSRRTDIAGLYEEALRYGMYRFVQGYGAVLFEETVAAMDQLKELDYSILPEKKFVEDIKRRDLETVGKTIDEVVQKLKRYNYNSIKLYLMHWIYLVLSTLDELDRTRLGSSGLQVDSLAQRIMDCETLEESGQALYQAIGQASQASTVDKNEKHVILTEAVKEIIRHNYHDSGLYQQQIASMLKLSSTYAGKIFREVADISINDYLTEMRMTKAAELLEHSSLKVEEIMLDVGIENKSYFFKLFKKRYGATPREYARKKSLDEL
ncbi:MAG: hypothetical protein K0R57_3989 [Paenibacillaceae bacterium]|jgi:YesN/AraC family two-component response regulator|nr:hypothetical protein [Paenibacillaceae bacterium]